MPFGILRRFLNPPATNNKLRRLLNTAASDSKPIHNANGKLESGSQGIARDSVHNGNRKHKGDSQFRDAVSIQDVSLSCSEEDRELGRTGILVALAGIFVYLLHEEVLVKPTIEDRRRALLERRSEDEKMAIKWRERSEELKIKEEGVAKEKKILLEELEELKEKLNRQKNGLNI
ncbi:hypothetical protein FNV43_RR14268 [Rhamnella rubrinervis]|uniref:Uncharacterized protein n=1 Tax=Rhamnella rubrinervis TaxID=2594499 RepID=A0A8K0MG35_9ROSA|nr:hypothetical protein FNV43_RR14268 [Rhamnella rubrinervis]